MEEKKRKKQEDKTKKDVTQNKVPEQKTKVPDSTKASALPLQSLSIPSSSSSSISSSNGSRSPPQCGPRFPPREVPPRFRQNEHKQLLKRGQPLPTSISLTTLNSACTNTQSNEHLTGLPHQSGLGVQHENSPWGVPTSSSTCWDQVIVDEKDTEAWPSIYQSNSQSLECALDADSSEVVSSSMSMATGASQHSHYPISKASVNHPSSMVSSQGGPNRGWASEGKADLSMNSRNQSSWGSSNLNLNPIANPAAWPVLGHEAPVVGSGPGVSNSLPSTICGQGGVAPIHGTNGNGSIGCPNGNLVGDCAWGNADTPEQHQSPTNMSLSMEPPNLKTDGPNTKAEPMSPVNGWGGTLSQSPTDHASGDGTALWGNGDTKCGESKDSGWDSGGISSWGHGGGSAGWGEWNKQSSTDNSGWDANDGTTQEPMSSWGTDAPASEGSRGSSEGHSQRRERSSSVELPLLPRQDLDPRVLCNSGWGQTPVRQHTMWEMDENPDAKDEGSTEAWGSSTTAPSTGSAPPHPPGSVNPNLNAPPRMDPGSKNASEPSRGMPTPSWGGSGPPTTQPNTGWGEPPANKKVSNGSVGSWGEPVPDGPSTNGSSAQSWGSEEKSPSWEDGPAQPKSQGWGDGPNSSGWGSSGNGNNGEWGETSEGRKNGSGSSSWDGDGGSWKETQRGWGKAAPASSGGWGDSQRSNGPVQGWGGKPQEPTSGSSGIGNMGSWGGPNTVKQSSSGWASSGRQDPTEETTGWEEPSPSSIRRKMEIDDGTSTWGDPSAYRTSVNMWDRNNPSSHPSNSNNGGGNSSNNNHTGPNNNNHHHLHHGQGPTPNHSNGNNNGSPNQQGPPHSRMPMVNPGWGELPNVQSKSESTSWGEPPSTSSSVDNGTAAWGKPLRGSSGWGENCHESSVPYSRGSAPSGSGPSKPAPKSMQDSWGSGGEEMGMTGSQWDAEDGDMWTSPTSQDSSSSCNSWNQPKKGLQKGKISTKQDEAWIMNRLIKQLTDMGFPRDPAEEALRSNNMNLDQAMSALLEKKSEGDKRGMMSDYSSSMTKPLVCRPPSLSKDASLDRAPFLDKDGALSDDTPTSPFLPSPGLKLPLTNNSLPNHGLGGVSPGLAMQNLNNRQMNGMFGSSGAAQARALQQQAPPPQPPVPPLSSTQPNLRAQVPQFLSPQVQAQLLQFAAKNIGLNPALLTSPINPQQMTLLYQLQQLQMAYQRLQIQQQMMQAQRNVSGPIRQQEQQVARTINNMQQQIQQHQRQLAQALLMKQQQAPPGPAHPNLTKPNLDVFPGNPQASGLSISDLQTKEPQSSPSSFSPYQLSGLNGNVGVGCMDVGGMAMKDSPAQPQSRLSQWTHTSSLDSLTTSTPHMETSLSKHGSAASTHVADSKPMMEDSFSPYTLLSNSQSPSSPMVAPESWAQGKSPNDKMSNGTNISWPPEFCPGVPWKGLQNIDPEADPNMTPGSVSGGPTINTNIQDVNRYLLRDRSGAWSPTVSQSGVQVSMSEWPEAARSGSFSLPVNHQEEEGSTGKLLDMKSTWSTGPMSHTQPSMSHDLWKVAPGGRTSTAPSRPPPGLTNTKPTQSWTSGSLGLGQGWSSSYSSEGTAWSSDSSSRTSSWLVLRNLTPQIDGSTLRTLCMQHGPLITFHLSLPQGNALVRYSSKEEAAKAQKSLHMCVLGNTTILAEFAGEEEVTRFFAQGQPHPPNSSWQGNAAPGSNQQRMGNHWGSGGTAGTKTGTSSGTGGSSNGGDLLWGGVQQYSSLWGPANGEETRVMGSPIPINTLLPGDLLSGENM